MYEHHSKYITMHYVYIYIYGCIHGWYCDQGIALYKLVFSG